MVEKLFETPEDVAKAKAAAAAALPDDLKGKSPEELAAVIAKERTENKAVLARFNELGQQVTNLLEHQQRVADAATPLKKEEPPDFYNKPTEAVARVADALFEAKMKPYVDAFMSNEELRQLEEIMALPYAAKYADEIKAVLKSVAPEAKARAGFAKEAYHLVAGRHMKEIAESERTAKETAPEFTESVTAAGARRQASPALSADEKKVADGLGQSEEEYTKWRDRSDEAVAELMKVKK